MRKKAKIVWKILEKRNAFNETAYKTYKNLFETIKRKYKKNTPHKRYSSSNMHKEKMDCYERNNW